MTFKELTNKFYKVDDILNNKYIDEIIYFLSKISNDKTSLIVNANQEIDFELKDFLYNYKLVFIKNVPIEYVTKKTIFSGIEYNIDYGVFIPRQDTEFIVDWLLKSDYLKKSLNILDLCCGSGVIANTINYYKPELNVYGIDISSSAIQASNFNKNIHKLKTKFFLKNIFKLKEDFLINFDLIICNPPYIDYKYPLEKSVKKYEPKKALFAKDNGLDYYKRYIFEIFPLLKKESISIFEIGFDQKDPLEKFLINQKINNFYFLKDLNKNYRILVIEKD